MIVLNLSCDKLHRFEGWFASGDEFSAQRDRGIVTCPVCGSHAITKLPSGPKVRRSADTAETAERPVNSADSIGMALMMLAKHLAANGEDVGERFPEEARRIHYDETPARNIRGIATVDEARALIEEGIVVLPLLIPPKEEIH